MKDFLSRKLQSLTRHNPSAIGRNPRSRSGSSGIPCGGHTHSESENLPSEPRQIVFCRSSPGRTIIPHLVSHCKTFCKYCVFCRKVLTFRVAAVIICHLPFRHFFGCRGMILPRRTAGTSGRIRINKKGLFISPMSLNLF